MVYPILLCFGVQISVPLSTNLYWFIFSDESAKCQTVYMGAGVGWVGGGWS